MNVEVTAKNITISEAPEILSGEIGIETINFTFSSEWENLIKIAVFSSAEKTYKIPIENNKCDFPFFEQYSKVVVGVYGYSVVNELKVKQLSPFPTLIKIKQGSYTPAQADEEDIPASDFERYVQEIEDMIEGITVYTSYNSLSDHPQINGNELIGNKTSAELGLAQAIVSIDVVWYQGAYRLKCTLSDGTEFYANNNIGGSTSQAGVLRLSDYFQLAYSRLLSPVPSTISDTTSIFNRAFETSIVTTKVFDSLLNIALIQQSEDESFFINTALAGKQDTLTFDSTPTEDSDNPVTSGGIYTALSSKQATLTFDNVPTENSDNPVKSGGVYTAVNAKQDKASLVTLTDNSTTALTDNTEYSATDVNTLTFTYPQGDFECYMTLNFASSGTITVTFPTSSYIGTAPTFANGETWEVSVKNGVIVAGKVESNA